MSNTPPQPGETTATLEFDDAQHLTGTVSALPDGRLQLEAMQCQETSTTPSPDPATPGAHATLALVGNGGATPQPIRVKVCARHRDSFTLEFASTAQDIVQQFRHAIGGFQTANTHANAAILDAAPTDSPGASTIERALPGRVESKTLTMPVTAAYGALLETLRKQSLEQLELALPDFLADLEAHLLDQSARMKYQRTGKSQHYEAAKIIEEKGAIVARAVLQQLQDYYDDLTPQYADDQLWQYNIGSAEELDLIGLEEFEDFLAIDRMIGQSEEMYRVPLEALTVRLAVLIGVDPNTVRLPIHVRQLCRAFQRALIREAIPPAALPQIFDYFARHFIRQLDGLYAPLNALLGEHHVRPDVELEIQKEGYLLQRNKPVARPNLPRRHASPASAAQDGGQSHATSGPGDPSDTPVAATTQLDHAHQQLGEQLTGVLCHIGPDTLYRSVIDALNFKREAEGLADGTVLTDGTPVSGTWEGTTVASKDIDQNTLADAQSIARALSTLQRDSRARDEVRRSDSLRAYLADHKQDIGGLANTSGLTADSLNQLDMVDNLFGTIKSQLDVSTLLKPALGNLQIPLAKLALLDPRFFVDQSHSARNVVDKLSQLAASANFPNKALEGRINAIVDDIVTDYENDNSTFETALGNIDRLVAQQARALSRNIERVVRTQEGQEKLAQARRAVGKLIREKIPPPAAPKVLVELIDSGWRDLLVLTHVKEGPTSSAWEEQLRTLEQLCQWLAEEQQGELDDELSIQRALEAEPLLDLIEQQISSALPTNVSHEAVLERLAQILAGALPLEMAEVGDDLARLAREPNDVRAKIEDLPRLRRWVKRVEQLQANSWLTYRDKDNNKKRMQLAWISPARDRYIFVNERGQKVADLSAIRLARQLSRGVQPPAPADQLSVVDKSMYHTLEHVQKTLSFARNHDSLTKLINHETFLDQVGRAQRHSQRRQTQHAVLYLNIDQFKLVNEVYDRISGDQVLLEFARLLAQLHGKKSSSARIDADEFAVLLLDRNIAEAMAVAEKIRSDIAAGSLDIEGENVSFTVSIGVLAILEHSPDVSGVMTAARSAMLQAKHLGRNRVELFEEAQHHADNYKLEKHRIREDLENALTSERFVLRAQPIVQTAVKNRLDSSQHYELLLAIANKDGTLSSPQDFIQSAERYGFMPMVDRWVVREAFSWISGLMDAQKVVPNLAINLSGSSVTDDSFMEYLLEQISEFGVGTSRLCFEITETGTISNLVKAADFVRAFRNIGCKFSIDDFGTGLASHNYLRELPVDYVKIDGSFVTGIHKNRNDYAMARSINDLAHFLGQETIAESVENDAIVAKLEEIGVDYLQGWGVGKPKRLTEVTADLSNLEK